MQFTRFIVLLSAILFMTTGCEQKPSSPGNANKPETPAEYAATTAPNLSIDNLVLIGSLNTATREGVTITTSLYKTPEGIPVIGAHLKTLEAGFYIYSLSHDTAAADGIGIAANMSLVTNEQIQSIGPITESVQPITKSNETLEIDYSIYPEGEVTFYLPIEMKGDSASTDLQFSWQACMKNGICKNPVINLSLPHTIKLTQ